MSALSWNPFNFTISPSVLHVTIDSTMTPTVRASLDFQGFANFKLNLESSLLITYSHALKYSTSMEDPYFLLTYYIPNTTQRTLSAGGEVYTYDTVLGQVCLAVNTNDVICSVEVQELCVVTEINENNVSVN